MSELAIESTTARRFISSLSKSIQALCHGCMEFDSGIEIVGYINVNIDSNRKADYVLNERVQKSPNKSMTFVSNSFLAKKDNIKSTSDGFCSPVPELSTDDHSNLDISRSVSGSVTTLYPIEPHQHRRLRSGVKRTGIGVEKDCQSSAGKHSRTEETKSPEEPYDYSSSHKAHQDSNSTPSLYDQLKLSAFNEEDESNVNQQINTSQCREEEGDGDDSNITNKHDRENEDIKSELIGTSDLHQKMPDGTKHGEVTGESNYQGEYIPYNMAQADISGASRHVPPTADEPLKYNGQGAKAFPQSGYADGDGEASRENVQFDVIEIGDEDADVKAMFGDALMSTKTMSMSKLEKFKKKLKADQREETMKLAIADVLRGMPCQRVGRLYNIPRVTLSDRVAKARQGIYGKNRSTRERIFTDAQENMLKDHCLWIRSIGYELSEWHIIDMASQMAFIAGKKVPGRNWFYKGFLNRHPDVKLTGRGQKGKPREEFTLEMGNIYFRELGKLLDDIGIKNCIHHNYIMDESGILLDEINRGTPVVVGFAKERRQMIVNEKSPSATLLSCVNGAGESLPLYIVVQGKEITDEMKSGTTPGTVLTCCDSGWTNSAIFQDWLENHFKKHVPQERPLIIFYDGYTTHYSVETIAAAMLEGIHLLALPPQSSLLVTSSSDSCVFGPLKRKLHHNIHTWMADHPMEVMSKASLPSMISNAFYSSMLASTIISGFAKRGICPFKKKKTCSKKAVK